MVFPAGGISDLCSHSQNAHCPTCPVPSTITPSAPRSSKDRVIPHLSQCIFFRLVLVLATMDSGIFGFPQPNLTYVPQSCWDPELLCFLWLPLCFPWSRAPDFSASLFVVWVPKAWHSPWGFISLLIAFAHLGYQPVAILFSLHLSYFCVMQMCNQLYSGWMGVGWGEMETEARKREAQIGSWVGQDKRQFPE